MRIKTSFQKCLSQTWSSNIHQAAVAVFAALLLSGVIGRAGVFYVKTSGDDTQSGASWALAKHSISNTLAVASAGDQIWVATGIYAELVALKSGVSLYGGFAGHETALAQRNWTTHLAILDGRSKGTVVTIANAGPDTRLDGMVITGGLGIFGGGISIVAAGPVIANNFITRNTVNGGAGGGIFISGFQATTGAQPGVLNNTIYQNISLSANGDGAGIAVAGSSPLIAYNRVLRNLAARHAGGIGCWKDSRPLIANNVIEANAASAEEGVIGIGGGILATAADLDGRPVPFAVSAPVIINNVIAANGAQSGGGIGLADSTLGAATVKNNTIIANTGSGIFWGNTSPTNCNNLVAFNSVGIERLDTSMATLRNNDVYGNMVLAGKTDYAGIPDVTGSNANISAEPRLADYKIGDFHLQPDSPCVNAGLTSAVVPGFPDVDGQNRVLGGTVDIGAFESTGVTLNVPTPVIHVSPSGTDGDGLSWVTAKRTVQGGISAAAPGIFGGGEVWVAEGNYPEHIVLPAFVYLYGGFAGTETGRAARDPAAHRAVLDGGGKPTIVLSQSAGYLVSALDGFTVQNGGIFTGGQFPGFAASGLGGGIRCSVSAPLIANNLIQSNSIGNPFDSSSESHGAGIYCYLAHAQITGNTIRYNEVLEKIAGSGGGIYCLRSLPTIEQNSLSQDHAKYGSAIIATISSARIVRNTVEANWMYSTLPNDLTYMGGVDGAVFLSGCTNFLIEANTIQGNIATFGAGLDLKACQVGRVENNLLSGNLAKDPLSQIGWGGGLYCEIDGQTLGGDILVINNTIVGNAAPGLLGSDQGGGIAMSLVANTLVLANNTVAFNSGGLYQTPGQSAHASLANNCVFNAVNYINLSPGPGDISVDPQFVNRVSGDYHLLPVSPCIDAGTNLNGPATDKDGVPRPLDGKNDGVPAFDIGAYEFVNPLADTDHDGMPDQAELIAGTNPTDPASVLKLQARLPVPGNAVVLSWLSVTGRTYRIQFKPALTGSWQTLTSIPGTGAMLEVLDPQGTGGSRFYQLEVQKN